MACRFRGAANVNCEATKRNSVTATMRNNSDFNFPRFLAY
jgi:hypothetical protein